MNKKSWVIIGVVILLVISTFLIKNIIGKDKEQEQSVVISKQTEDKDKDLSKTNLEEQFDYINSQSKPTLIIFSYEGDCCESTKKFFDEYNTNVSQLMTEYEDEFESLLINTGLITSEEEKEVLIKIANDYGVSTLPSILICDKKGEKVQVIEGPFDLEKVKIVMNEVVDSES
ncbi:MAG: hypothetical protein CVU84_10050 [Firmicutes bacterium HGW-Firmicutes-1]|nr:MAG: hypothetical protein CVU84_10050 [Firmicutes bacterium HGW-Firmicutes-1]